MIAKLLNNLRPYRHLIFKKKEIFGTKKKRSKYLKKTERKIVFYRKSCTLTKFFVGKTIKVHNGRKLLSKSVTSRMAGLRAGELIMTRAFFEHKKKKKKKRS